MLMLESHWGAVPLSSSHGSTMSAATGKIYHHANSFVKKNIICNVSELPRPITSYVSWVAASIALT
jgi:hypothetical protein